MNIGRIKKVDKVLNMSNEDYHAHDSLSSSQLKLAYKNIELYKSRVIDKQGGFTSSPSMQLGTLFHELILEPENFNPSIYPGAKVDKRTVIYKEKIKNGIDPANIISEKDFDNLLTMKYNLVKHGDCPDFEQLTNEASFFYSWNDFNLRIRPDSADLNRHIIYDIKTTSSPLDSKSFFYQIEKYHYDLSAAMYMHGMKAHISMPWAFCFVVCQSVAPYSTAIYWVGESLYYQGFQKYRQAMKNIYKAKKSKNYIFQPKAEVLETFRPVEKFESKKYYKLVTNNNSVKKEILL